MRVCRAMIGPAELSLTAKAASMSTGAKNARRALARAISSSRLRRPYGPFAISKAAIRQPHATVILPRSPRNLIYVAQPFLRKTLAKFSRKCSNCRLDYVCDDGWSPSLKFVGKYFGANCSKYSERSEQDRNYKAQTALPLLGVNSRTTSLTLLAPSAVTR